MHNELIIPALMSHGELLVAIGKKARACRERQRLSRRELSEKSGVSVATISRFELKGTATLDVMLRIARALDALDSFQSLFEVAKYRTMSEFLES